MAATKYMVMFRYINPITNQAITNDMGNEYKEEFHLIHDEHPFRKGDEAWEKKIDAMVMEGNDASNPKYNMLFVFGGTKKIPKYKNYPIDGEPYGIVTGIKTGYPYVVKDVYKRVTMSPWFHDSTYGSLTAALEKVKTMVDMIGLDNVKLIKVVPFDQKIKII